MINSQHKFLVYCNENGKIIEVVYNNLAAQKLLSKDYLFGEIFGSFQKEKVENFLSNIKMNSAAFGKEIKIIYQKEEMYLGGVFLNSNIIILGSGEPVQFQYFLSEFIAAGKKNIGLKDSLNEYIKLSNAEDRKSNSKLFDEISRLNNQLVNMQREIAKKNSELLKLNKTKNEFLGMAAHDLRNPLGFIGNYCELLEEEKESLSEDQIEFIKHIKSLDDYMLNLVNDLLDISSIEAGKLNLQFEKIDLINFFERIINFFKLIAGKKNIEIVYTTSHNLLKIRVDHIKIEQVIANLLSNAIKNSGSGTKIYFNVVKQSSYVEISVRDEGNGIEEADLHLLFKPFQKLVSKNLGEEKSTGLGLYIAKEIVEGHNGKIWVNSKYGFGSTFTFSLPLSYI